MVGLIIFRDLFVTGLRMMFLNNGISLVTSRVAKAKTGIQLFSIVLILIYLALATFPSLYASGLIDFIDRFNLIWYSVLLTTLFTVYTGLNYLYVNRKAIQLFIVNSNRNM